MKRLLVALPVALILVLSLAVPVLADDGGSTLQVDGDIDTGLDGGIEMGFSNQDVKTPSYSLHEELSVQLMQGSLQETKVVKVGTLKKDTSMTWGAEGWSSQQRYQDGVFDLGQKVIADAGIGEFNESKDVSQKSAFEVAKTLDYEGNLIKMEMSAINKGDVNTGGGLSLDAYLVEELSAMAKSTDDGIANVETIPAHCEWVEAYCDPGRPAQCVEGGCATCPVEGYCAGGQCDMCGDDGDEVPCGTIQDPQACEECQCCEWIPPTATCQMCCTLEEAVDPHCVPAHCEWIEEDPGSWGTQDIFTFEVDIPWVAGNVQTGLTVLPKDTQDIEATEHQSWTGMFTFSKSYVVTDNDPVPEEGPAAPPVPIPPVP
jgi:hypothetical protein